MLVLDAPGLGTLDLMCGTEGYAVLNFEVGYPEERRIVNQRALRDGVFDNTRYLGGRTITMTVLIDDRYGVRQQLVDRLKAYMSPRVSTTMTYTLPESPAYPRQLRIRGVNAPIRVDERGVIVLIVTWFSPDAVALSPFEEFLQISPFGFNEQGRVYDLTFDRQYLPQPPVGGAIVLNSGNHPIPWKARLTSEIQQPIITVNGIGMRFDVNGGVNLNVGETLDIDFGSATIRLNNDPTESRYDRVNFNDWEWDQLLLQPGANIVRIQGTAPTFDCVLEVTWRDGWL